jgi:hypothetical protein
MVENKLDTVQIEGYKRMSGEERVLIVFRLNQFLRDIVQNNIVNEHPEFTEQEIRQELHRRFLNE